ncbi:MAG: hypothetical protein ABI680_17895, partial [Chthoniobacteraceae bacterium]
MKIGQTAREPELSDNADRDQSPSPSKEGTAAEDYTDSTDFFTIRPDRRRIPHFPLPLPLLRFVQCGSR